MPAQGSASFPSGGPRGRKNSGNARFWCEYCRIYVYDNKICRTNHENSPQHKAAVQRYIEQIQRKERQESGLRHDFATRTGVSLQINTNSTTPGASSFYHKCKTRKAPQHVGLLSMGRTLSKGGRPAASELGKRSQVVGTLPYIPPSSGKRHESSLALTKDSDRCGEKDKDTEDAPIDVHESDTGTDSDACQSDLEEEHCVDKADAASPLPINQSQGASATGGESVALKIELRKFVKPANLRKSRAL